jgi:hypothetical protein
MRMISNKFTTDTFIFDPTHNYLKYYTSDTLYEATSAEMLTLLGLATTGISGGITPINYSDFTVPTLSNYLYLIWDLRKSNPVYLCYDAADRFSICCECTTTTCHTWLIERQSVEAVVEYIDCSGVTQTVTLNSGNANPFYEVCVLDPNMPTLISGTITLDMLDIC